MWINVRDFYSKREIHCIPPDQLDEYLIIYILSVRKNNVEEYEPYTIRYVIPGNDLIIENRKRQF